jgi:phenylacetate-CoA ligase
VLDVRSTIEEQAAWLVQERPTYLQTYPSIVYEIARHFIGPRKKTLTSIRRVITYGEAFDRRVRDACRRAWGVDVLDSYSANEVGHIAAQCSSCRAYHVHAEHLIIEILDDEGRPCTPGEIGRVVVTDLFNYAMPLIRYEIGDLAEAGGVCDCGRNLPTLRRILGRQRNMFVLANGQKRWPAMEVDALGAFEGRLPIRQFQAIQHGPVEIEVKLVVTRPLTAQEESGIRALLAGWFSDGLQIRFSYVPEIPRSPSGKFEDFLCEIGRRE